MEQQGLTVWFTGLSGAGKTTIAMGVTEKLKAKNYKVELLDGDVVRTHLSKGLSFGFRTEFKSTIQEGSLFFVRGTKRSL